MPADRSRAAAVLVLALALLLAGLAAGAPPAAAEDPVAVRPDVVRCGTADLRALVGDDAWTAPGAAPGAAPDGRVLPCDGTPVGPPPDPQVGDSWDWWIWSLNGFPTATLQSCTVRGMGPNCYVVVEDTQWNVNIDQTQVDTIVDRFENSSIGPFPAQGIWDLDTSHFGMPPDQLDQDPRVYILYYDFDVSSDGFFWGFDQACDGASSFHSNECDVVYMNCSDFDPAGEYLLAVLAHEFEHLIHYGQDADEASWVDEGLAELAMWLYGNPDNISQFNSNPDRQLTNFNGAWADYIKTYLWSLYFYERYGGQAAILSVTQEPRNGILGYDTVLDLYAYPEDFADVFADWTVANFLDDPTIGDGRYGYLGDDLPPFQPFATFSTYPVGPNTTTVNRWAADYVRYVGPSPTFQVTFDGSDSNLYAVRALLLDPVSPTQVVDMTLDAGQAGSLVLPEAGDTHDEVVVVHASTSSTGTLTYQYGAGSGTVDAPVVADAAALALEVRGSGSARPSLRFRAPAAGFATRLEVVDVTGRRVRVLHDGPADGAWRTVAWDGRDASGVRVASGTYFARLSAAEGAVTETITLVR